MKYLLIVGDGMADYPIESLDGRTPLQVAVKPNMDRIARNGCSGLFRTIREGSPTGSAVANLSILGYDSLRIFQSGEGRGVLEAASLGVPIEEDDLVMRINLISLDQGRIRSHSSGHIGNEEAHRLIADLQAHFLNWGVRLYPGLSYRHVLIVPHGKEELECAPPHDHLDEDFLSLSVRSLRPDADATADRLNRMILESHSYLSAHPLNRARLAEGKQPANCLWPWAPGKKPQMATLRERFGISGAVITAVDLIKGIAMYAGMDVIAVEGATGLFTTNYEGKADAALAALHDHDLVYVHVEAIDEAGHDRDLALKLRCIEDLDRRLIGRLMQGIERENLGVTIAVLPDHPTPIAHGAHTRDPVPVAIWDPGRTPDPVEVYDEKSAASGSLGLLETSTFMETFLGRLLP